MTENITLDELDNTTDKVKKNWKTPIMTYVDISRHTEAMSSIGHDGIASVPSLS